MDDLLLEKDHVAVENTIVPHRDQTPFFMRVGVGETCMMGFDLACGIDRQKARLFAPFELAERRQARQLNVIHIDGVSRLLFTFLTNQMLTSVNSNMTLTYFWGTRWYAYGFPATAAVRVAARRRRLIITKTQQQIRMPIATPTAMATEWFSSSSSSLWSPL